MGSNKLALPASPSSFERKQFTNKWIQSVIDMSDSPEQQQHTKHGRDGEAKQIKVFGRPRPISREGNRRKGIDPRSEGGFYEEQNSELSSNYYRNDSMLDSAYGSMASVPKNISNAMEPTSRSSWSSGFDSFKPEHYALKPPDSAGNNMRKPPPMIFGKVKKEKDAKERNFKLLLPLNKEIKPKNVETQDKTYKTSPESKALQVAALSQALGYIDKFQKTQELKNDKSGGPDQLELNDLAKNLQQASQGAVFTVPNGLKNPLGGIGPQNKDQQVTEVLAKEYIRDIKSEEAFCAAVSLNDGLVMNTTVSITDILGYPKDMWVGRSFIDFIHPQDRVTFTSQITEGIILPISKHGQSNDKQERRDHQSRGNGFFCRMRKYNGLKSGFFSVKERKTVYLPFKLSVCFRELSSRENGTSSSELEDSEPSAFGHQNTCLFITAAPMNSAYISPNEAGPVSYKGQSSFITKHGPTCTFSLVEESSIPFLGYLPQDLCGNDIFGYYHPQDLEILKEAFEAVMLEHGKPFRSKPYKFKIRNGCYILLVTDFSCFINPWSRKLEFIVGKHTVMKGPKSPDIFHNSDFSEAVEEDKLISDEILKQSKNIQNEIRQLLTETVHRTICQDSSKNDSRRRKQLTSFMGYLLDKMANSENKKKESGTSSGENNTLVLGDIAEDSSETPPSYNQLNYNENLTRFFNSQPKTLTEEEAIEEKDAIEEKKIDESISASTFSTNEGVKANTRKPQQDERREKGDERKPVQFYHEQTGSSVSKIGTFSDINKQKRETKAQKEINKDDGGRSGSSSGNQRNTTNSGSADPSSSLPAGMSAGQIHQCRDDGMASQDGTGSGDGSRLGSGSQERTSNIDDYKSPLLTEELLQVHDKGMEKKMIDMYKETRRMGELKFQKQRSLARSKALQAKERKNPFQKWHGINNGRVQKNHNLIKKNNRNLMQRDDRNPFSNNAYPQYRPMADTMHRAVGGSLPTSFNFSNPGQSSGGFSNPQHKQLSMRSSPPGLASFSNLISVPAFYFPTSASGALPNMPASNSFFECNTSRPGMMLQTGSAYIPINALPGFYPAYPAKDDLHQAKKDNQSSHHTQTPQSVQSIPDLPNSLAVKSCIADKHDSVKSDKSNQANLPNWVQKNGQHVKFMIPKIRDHERESVKAEPGSALESNASASASVKDKRVRSPAGHSPDHKYGSLDKRHSESSSSLYSLLKSSDEYTITESDFIETDQEKNPKEKIEKNNSRPRPVLSEPFWNDNVVVNNDLLYNYQLEIESLEDILKRDMEALSLLTQSPLANEQLSMLYGEIYAKGEMANPLLYENCSIEDEDDDTENSDNSECGMVMKKRERYEALNLIHGADAPFPMPDSPGHPQQKIPVSIMNDWSSSSETPTESKSTSSKSTENGTQTVEPGKDNKELS